MNSKSVILGGVILISFNVKFWVFNTVPAVADVLDGLSFEYYGSNLHLKTTPS